MTIAEPTSEWSMTVFRAMGTTCRIVAPTHDLVAHGQELVYGLERMWSRFDEASEISAINATDGQLCIVSSPTYELISLAELARTVTGGQFNPLMLDQLTTLGYDRSWELMSPIDEPAQSLGPGSRSPIQLFPDMNAIRLPAGTRFDPGGIGKGLAGDMVAAALLEQGAHSAQVELGGDVRLAGPGWGSEGWRVVIDDSDHGVGEAATLSIASGGVATSSVVRRRWRCGDIDAHHLIDASTGVPAVTDLDAVTVAGPTLWWAEVAAKVALMGGSAAARRFLADHEMTGVLVSGAQSARYEVVTSERVLA